MIEIKGVVVTFKKKPDDKGHSEFVFLSDSCKEYSRIRALCTGILPDVVPGVPLKISFPVDERSQIKTLGYRAKSVCTMMNQVTDARINYQDEDYARDVLLQVKGVARKTAGCILNRVDGDLTKLADKWDDAVFWKSIPGSKRYLPALREKIGPLLAVPVLFEKYSCYGIGYPQIETLSMLYGTETEEKLRELLFAQRKETGDGQ